MVEPARWWRRRFLWFAVAVSAVWIVSGVLFGWMGRWGAEDRVNERGGGSPAFLFAIVGAAVVATIVAYRRLARPASELLEGAERIGAGDYRTRVRPSGPRAVRTLGGAFNEMAGRLEASEESRRRFLADVTHELRTPITVLQAEVEAQLDGIHPRDDHHLQLLRDQARTLERLVDDLRTLALGDAGRLTLHREQSSLRALVEDAGAAAASMAAPREVTVETSVTDDVEIDADPVRIGQVLGNLLNNAVRHTPPGGTVRVRASLAVAGVEMVVADTGPGLGDDPERVFDRFHASADSGGTGLGLTIARQLVEAHGGTLAAANAAGGGAVFTVRLPRS